MNAVRDRRDSNTSQKLSRFSESLSLLFSGASVHIDGPISVRENSEVFHAVIDLPDSVELAIKRCLIPGLRSPDEFAAKEQFVALQRAYEKCQDREEQFRTPRPIHFVPDLATYAMSWVPGESLSKKLSYPAAFWQGQGWFELAGVWLGHFHRAGPVRKQLVCVEERLHELNAVSKSPLNRDSFANGIEALHHSALAFKDIQVDVSWLHGDCKCDNFLMEGEQVFGIDFSLTYENPVEYDLAQFLNNLEILLSTPRYLHLIPFRARFERAFLMGYAKTGPIPSNAYLNWLRLAFAITFWHNTVSQNPGSFRSWMFNLVFDRLVTRLTKEVHRFRQLKQ